MQFTASMEVARKLPFFVLALLAAVSSSSLRAKGEEEAQFAAASSSCPGAKGEEEVQFNVSKLEMFVDELPDMPKLQGYAADSDGVFVPGNLTVGMYQRFWKFHRDLPPTLVFAYGTSKDAATVPGPTIEALRGVPTYVTWTNHLPPRHILPWDPTITTAKAPSGGVPTVVHLHGGVHPPTSDGSSLAWFTSGFAAIGPAFAGATDFYPNQQPPGNLWYHDHAMGLVRVNLLAGLVGAYILRAPDLEEPLGLPSGPEFDRLLVIFDRSFLANGSLYMNPVGNNPCIHPQWQPEYFGSAVVVNGKAWPFLRVRRRRYRFRIVNASNARFFRLFFSGTSSDSLRFNHIGSDNNYLPRPVSSRKFLLAPSEIADVVVDFSKLPSTAASVVLANDAQYPYPSGDPTDDLNGRVMRFLIEPGVESDPSSIPERLLQLPTPSVDLASTKRYIAMYEYVSEEDEPTHLYLNALPYEAPVTETPKAGSSEVWAVINLTEDNHPLHVHLATFTVLDQRNLTDSEAFRACMNRTNDALACGVEKPATLGGRIAVAPHERGWKNVYKMQPGVVTRILVRFAPLDGGSYSFDATAEPGYVYHCHILDHEDNEMMRPLKLVQ